MKKNLQIILILMFTTISLNAQQSGYKRPPKDISDLIEAPQSPAVSLNASKDWMLLMEQPGYPSIDELSQPELRLAGLRMNPKTNGPSRSGYYTGLVLKEMKKNKDFEVMGLPENPRISNVSWSVKGDQFAFTITQKSGLELWVVDVATPKARQLTAAKVNGVMRGAPFTWMPDGKSILVKMIPEDRGEMPQVDENLLGPIIQESKGEETTLRTYQDLLQNPADEALFEYLAKAQIMKVDIASGNATPFAEADIISGMSPSPDGNYVMLQTINRPFSYLVPYYRFPETVEIVDPQGQSVREVYSKPLIVELPKGFDATYTGPRSFSWRSDRPATLVWVEALDEGDPNYEVEYRDQLFYLDAPFNGTKKEGIKFQLRYAGITWGNDELAIARERWWSDRTLITSRFQPGQVDSKKELFNQSYDDRYNDPGSFLTEENEYGRNVLLMAKSGDKLFLAGEGASPQGNRPFLREFDLNTKSTKEYWRSSAPYYEEPVAILDLEKSLAITRRQSREEPPNYYITNWEKDKNEALTAFPHPYPALKGIEKQVVKYKRADGIDLQGELYLPKGFQPGRDEPLPVLMWAYPREYKSKSDASQVSGSPYQFIRLYWGSPIYWVTQGYAVFDRASMPIVGEGDAQPNDSFREQLVDNAAAAIDKLVEMKVADRDRIGVGGHSYGAFMTANLLAHCDLFAAGIARSGAYNRTLTPFGFQREERTYWDAPELYYYMSPFMHADKINEPLLMIHGEADNNSGTFPLQSKRMYSAINGLGGKARLVMLPHESHGYRAKESILHCLHEMNQWVDKYVKNRERVKP